MKLSEGKEPHLLNFMVSSAQDQNILKQNINRRPIFLNMNSSYFFDQVTDIKRSFQLKEGTSFKFLLDRDKNQLTVSCKGLARQQCQQKIQEKQKEISQCCKFEIKVPCLFEIKFRIIKNRKNEDALQDLILSEQNEDEQEGLGNNKYFLFQQNLQHSSTCIAFEEQFKVQRTLRFLQNNKDFLQKLIHGKYEQKKIPETTKIYIEYISQFLGYDFLFYDFELSGYQKNKQLIRRKFDNLIVQKARLRYQIPSTQTRSQGKRKKLQPKYAVFDRKSKDIKYDQTKDSPKNQQISAEEELLKQDDGEYKPSFRKKTKEELQRKQRTQRSKRIKNFS